MSRETTNSTILNPTPENNQGAQRGIGMVPWPIGFLHAGEKIPLPGGLSMPLRHDGGHWDVDSEVTRGRRIARIPSFVCAMVLTVLASIVVHRTTGFTEQQWGGASP